LVLVIALGWTTEQKTLPPTPPLLLQVYSLPSDVGAGFVKTIPSRHNKQKDLPTLSAIFPTDIVKYSFHVVPCM
jgi:hypothetical protein